MIDRSVESEENTFSLHGNGIFYVLCRREEKINFTTLIKSICQIRTKICYMWYMVKIDPADLSNHIKSLIHQYVKKSIPISSFIR